MTSSLLATALADGLPLERAWILLDKARWPHGHHLDVRATNGTTPLMWAALWVPEAIPALVAYGADVNAVDDKGQTALFLAAQFHVDGCHALLDAGADPNASTPEGWTVLMVAARHRPEAIACLLQSGACPRRAREDGQCALSLAAEHATDPSPLLALLAAGADPMPLAQRVARRPHKVSDAARTAWGVWNAQDELARALPDAADAERGRL